MLLNAIYIILGLFFLIWSADKFIDGASDIARYFKVSPIIIGIFIVGIGTSSPEILVSVLSAIEGKAELAVGNAVGSNIANIALIMGITALAIPITVNQSFIKKEFLILIAVSFLGFFVIQDKYFSRFDALILFLSLIFFFIFMFNNALKDKNINKIVDDNEHIINIKKSLLWCFTGLFILIISSKLLVEGAVNIATYFGVSELVIGLTIVAIGTSLPELASSLIAVKKNQGELVIGNIIGSNIFNLIAVLPFAGIIKPFEISEEVLSRDFPFMLCLTILFLIVCYSTKGNGKINRIEGGFLLSSFMLYQGYLIYSLI